MKQYRTVPFNPVIKEREATREGAASVAKQMEEQIRKNSVDGWSFTSYETIQVTVNHGCLAAFGGKANSLVTYGVLVFEREQ